MTKEYVIGVTGASGVIYARRILEVLCEKATVHIVISDVARRIAEIERVDLSRVRRNLCREQRSCRGYRQRVVPVRRDGNRALQHEDACSGQQRICR